MGYIPSFPVALLMLFITMISWGSWANTLKKCGNWRFEAFYWDYAWSGIFWALVLSILLGGVSPDGWRAFQFLNSLQYLPIAGVLFAIFAGLVSGFGNILLVTAIVLSGFAVAFPLALGLSLILGTTLAYITNPVATSHPLLLFAGLVFVTLAVITDSLAYHAKEKFESKSKNLKRGIIISVLSGILISLSAFPFNYAFKSGINGYQGIVFLAIGAFFAAAILLQVLMHRPLIPQQAPIGFKEYRRAKPIWHAWAILAGLIWAVGTLFYLVAASQPFLSVAIAYTLGQCAPMIGAIWGIFVWKEFKSAPKRANFYLKMMFILFITGIIFLANAAG